MPLLPLPHRFWQSACIVLIFCSSSVKPQQPKIPSIKLQIVTLKKTFSVLNNQMFAAGNCEQRVLMFLEHSYVKSHCSSCISCTVGAQCKSLFFCNHGRGHSSILGSNELSWIIMSVCSRVLTIMQNGANPCVLLKDTSALQMFAAMENKRNHRLMSDIDRWDWNGLLDQNSIHFACAKSFYSAESSAWAVANNHFVHYGTWQLSVHHCWRGPDIMEYWCKTAPVDCG